MHSLNGTGSPEGSPMYSRNAYTIRSYYNVTIFTLSIFSALYTLLFPNTEYEISDHHDGHKGRTHNQGQACIRVKRHPDDNQDQIHNNNVVADREPFGLEIVFLHLITPALSEPELAEGQCEPRHHPRKNTCTVDVQEQLGIRHQVVQDYTDQQQGDRNNDAVAWNPAFGQLLKKAGACPFSASVYNIRPAL